MTLWQATNPDARDFRLETLGAGWTSSEVQPGSDGTYRVMLDAPEKGWRAGFLEVRFDDGGPAPLIFTTGVRVVPDVLPFHPPQPGRAAVRAQP